MEHTEAWKYIRGCVKEKQTQKLQNFNYFMGKGEYQRQAIKLNWVSERNYDQKGKILEKGATRPIEICLTMPPHNPSRDSWCPPFFIWEIDEFYSKELSMESLMQFDI